MMTQNVFEGIEHVATEVVIGLFRVLRKSMVGVMDGDNKFSVG